MTRDVRRGAQPRLPAASDASTCTPALLVVTAHALVCDRVSLDVLLGELRAILTALHAGAQRMLPALPVDYRDAASAQHARTAAEVLEPKRDAVCELLRGCRQFELPADHPRPRLVTASGDVASMQIGKPLCDALAAAFPAADAHAAPFVTLLAALYALFYRYTGEVVALDVVLGGARTGNARYFIPAFRAGDLALVALALTALNAARQARASRMWFAAFGVVFAVRIASCALIAQSTSWWSDYNKRTIEVARLVSAAKHPVVVSDDYVVWALALAEYANPDIAIVLRPRCYLCDNAAPAPQRPLLPATVSAAETLCVAGAVTGIAVRGSHESAARERHLHRRTSHVPRRPRGPMVMAREPRRRRPASTRAVAVQRPARAGISARVGGTASGAAPVTAGAAWSDVGTACRLRSVADPLCRRFPQERYA